MSASWTPTFGPLLDASGARLRVWASGASRVRVAMVDGPTVEMSRVHGDTFEASVVGAHAGDRYWLCKDDHPPWPDPCSRWQPDGVHGPSMLVDPTAFAWSDAGWRGVPRHRLAIYELHVGTFTPEGTLAGVRARLPDLVDLGVTAIELMPVAAFPGTRNWGYDGGALFAPSERYGHPDDLRALVDRAHQLGVAVLLDVVYNHLGPDGAYLAAWMPSIFTDRHTSAWGRGVNLDGPGSDAVRRVLCDNALHWLIDYHLDGLRLDATHALNDNGPEHLLAQLAREVSMHICDRDVHLIAEDERNLATIVHPVEQGGCGMTGVWADDFHHAVRRHLAGDHEAWFRDFEGSADEIAGAVRDGWVFSGQHAPHYGGPRGTSPTDLPIEAAVICLQNHDQVGNRALGDRLHHQIGIAAWLAATTLLLMAPETPLLFMGQEWAASSPFLFFTDHDEPLGTRVIEGRRREFRRFAAFRDPQAQARIPSPQDEATWRRSVLDWDERGAEPHALVLAETRALLALRHAHISAHARERSLVRCTAVGRHGIWLDQPSARGGRIGTYVDLSGTAARAFPWEAASSNGDVHLLHASSPEGRPLVRSVTIHDGVVTVDAETAPFGLVLHLPGAAS